MHLTLKLEHAIVSVVFRYKNKGITQKVREHLCRIQDFTNDASEVESMNYRYLICLLIETKNLIREGGSFLWLQTLQQLRICLEILDEVVQFNRDSFSDTVGSSRDINFTDCIINEIKRTLDACYFQCKMKFEKDLIM